MNYKEWHDMLTQLQSTKLSNDTSLMKAAKVTNVCRVIHRLLAIFIFSPQHNCNVLNQNIHTNALNEKYLLFSTG